MAADRQTAIGAFVFGGITLGLAAFVFFGNFRLFSPTKQAAIVFEDSISGLSVGAPVNFRGVRVGAVDGIAIQFEPRTHTAYIPVTLQLEPDRVRVLRDSDKEVSLDLTSLIARGLRAELHTQSFVTGQSEINLDFDPSSTAFSHPGIANLPEIPTKQSAIQRVTEQLTQLPVRDLVVNANAALESIRALSDKLDSNLPPLVASVKSTSDGASHTVAVASQAIADLQGKLGATLDRATQFAANSDQQVSQRSADLHALLVSANQTVLQAHDVINDLKSLTSPRGDTRANLDATLRDLAASAASLRGFANDVEHNPQLLLTGRRQ